MARTDIHFDAMLRHLGAAYYESLRHAARSIKKVDQGAPPRAVQVR
jgi:hypothetical protein